MRKIRLLLQCSIPFAEDDWHVGRFSLLAAELGRWADVTARNREPGSSGDDPVLVALDRAQFDEVWLLGVDGGDGLTPAECAAVNRFHAAGGGLLATRDHADMGRWLRAIEGVGAAHYFHDPSCREPDPARQVRDDLDTPSITWPNYHSGRNGDVQRVELVEPRHPLLQRDAAHGGGGIEWFPAHPHEGAVGAPASVARARVVARGRSRTTGGAFNLVVALDRTPEAPGRAVAESSFHHFADYNWDTARRCPSFVTEREGDAIQRDPALLDDVRAYVRNCVHWLAPATP